MTSDFIEIDERIINKNHIVKVIKMDDKHILIALSTEDTMFLDCKSTKLRDARFNELKNILMDIG